MSIADGPLWLVGCGNMGGAMLRRWLAAGLDPAEVTVFTRHATAVPDGVRHLGEPPPDEVPATLVLAVKPQQIDQAAATFGGIGPALMVSILAGVDQPALAARFNAGAIVRAMPNLPVEIGAGVVALGGAGLAATARDAASRLMAPLGLVEWVDDAHFDAVTALAGCGPGFVFRFADALASAGVALGLARDQALRLAVATLAGAGAMAAQADEPPARLADRVASPGGSTRAGLDILDEDQALIGLMTATLAASAGRNAELAGEAGRSADRGQACSAVN